MRLIEYKCHSCGKIFEEFVKSNEKVLCPVCGREASVNLSGKMYGATGKPSGGCDGNCKNCKGCGK